MTAGGFVVVDASIMRALVGPYCSLADARANARRLVSFAHVWRETADRNGGDSLQAAVFVACVSPGPPVWRITC
jgi:hypothetical protein